MCQRESEKVKINDIGLSLVDKLRYVKSFGHYNRMDKYEMELKHVSQPFGKSKPCLVYISNETEKRRFKRIGGEWLKVGQKQEAEG